MGAMDHILHNLMLEHDWRWTLVAAAICLAGMSAAMHTLVNVSGAPKPQRTSGVLGAALLSALTLFATHFTALQGYAGSGPLRYDALLSVVSFLIPLVGIGSAAALVAFMPGRAARIGAALIAMGSVAAMHFAGAAALRFDGTTDWNVSLIAVSVVVPMIVAGVTGTWLCGPSLKRQLGSAAIATACVLFLDLMASAAMTVHPGPSHETGLTLSGGQMLVLLAAMVAALAMLGALFVWTTRMARRSGLQQMIEAIDAMSDGFALYDRKDRLVAWNARYAAVSSGFGAQLKRRRTMTDILREAMQAGAFGEMDDPDGWLAKRIEVRKTLRQGPDVEVNGRWFEVQHRPTSDGGLVTIVHDITTLKQDQIDLARARDEAEAANAAKSRFLANMSHEIRTPLNGVIGVAQALGNTSLTLQQQEMLELIQSSGHTLQALLSDLLDIAKVESGRLEIQDEAFDLTRLVKEAGQLYRAGAEQKGLQFFVEVAPEVGGWMIGDVVRLKQILTNLVSNAVKFTEEGFVSLMVAEAPARDDRAMLRFSVDDTGIGFDCATRERLFSRFEQAGGGITRKFGGTGLGLAISRQLAELMGGELDCESAVGGGSSFMLTVPLQRVEAPVVAEPAPAPVQPAAPGRRVRVLLADDHPVNRKVVEMVLAQIDADLTSVEDGLAAVRAHQAQEFDVILMDMQMPKMDGLTATREIRLHEAALGLPRTPVVMLTANALTEHVAAAHEAGADRHLAKPFDAAELLALVTELPAEFTAPAQRAA